METTPSTWPAPTGSPTGTSGWYLANDGEWYQSATPPGPGYVLGGDGRWDIGTDPGEAWRSSRWGLGDFWWGVLVYLVASLALSVVTVVVLATVDGSRSIEEVELGAYALSVLTVANVLAFAGVPWLATRRKGQRSLRLDFGLHVRPIDLAIGLGTGVMAVIGASIVGAAIDNAFDLGERTGNVPIDRLDGAGQFAAFFVAVAVVTPIIEELFFRGLIYRSLLKRGTNTVVAVLVTTAIFVVPHLTAADSWPTLLSLAASIGVLGLSFNLACHWAGNRLGAAIVAHMVINGLAVLSLAVS